MDNMDEIIMMPKIDYCFKELMQDKDILKAFLLTVLDIENNDIISIKLEPTETRKMSSDDKIGILDVKVALNNNTIIDIEIQISSYKYWPDRSMFYTNKTFTEELKSGEEYDKLKKCIHIGILDFILYKGTNEYHSCFHLREDIRHEIYSDKLEFHILELPKVIEAEYLETPLYNWLKFFNIKTKKELFEMYGKDEYIDKACDTILRLSSDKEKKLEYDNRFKALSDFNTYYHSSLNKGAIIERISQIKSKLDKGKTVEKIAEEIEQPVFAVKYYLEIMNKCEPDESNEDIADRIMDYENTYEFKYKYGDPYNDKILHEDGGEYDGSKLD